MPENVGEVVDARRVLAMIGVTVLVAAGGTAGEARAGDHFGQSLAIERFYAALAVGIPGKTIDGAAGAGAAVMLTTFEDLNLQGSVLVSQDSPGVPGSAEPGDGFGSSVTFAGSNNWGGLDLAVGVPDEDIDNVRNAGLVQTFAVPLLDDDPGPTLDLTAGEAITQESRSIPGGSEPGDRFGAAVQGGRDNDLWIGAPGESIGDVRAAGDVIQPHEVSEAADWEAFGQAFRLGGPGSDNLPGQPQPAAHVGASLGLFSASTTYSTSGGESLVVDVPAVDVGGVHTGEVYESGDADDIFGAGVYQDSAGPQPDEFYGSTAATMSNGQE